MRRVFLSVALLGLIVTAAFPQQTTPTPQHDGAVVKITTDLIQVDVTVTDRNGRVVTGLTAEDFEVFENGDRQQITNFSFVSRRALGAAVSVREGNTATTRAATEPYPHTMDGRTIAVVVDDLNLSFASVYYTRKALHEFVDRQMEPRDLVAIIRTGGGVGALQQFTSDKRLLKAAIDRLRWNPLGASGIDPLSSVGQSPEEVTERFKRETDEISAAFANPGEPKRKSILLRENVSEKKATDYQVSRNAAAQEAGIFAQSTLGTVRYVISGMDRLPGRKAMMLFSDGLTIGGLSGKSRGSTVFEYLRDVVDAANRSSVVVYTFDTKGMKSMSFAASDSTYEVIDGHRGEKERFRLDDFRNSQDGLVYFAEQTGGKALLNSNDLNAGIQRALDAQAGYYLLAYQPDTDTFDAEKRKFHKLEVKVKQPNLNVAYRSGFFNLNADPAAAPRLTIERQLADALMSPFVRSDIALNINALYASDPTDGPYIRSFLHIEAKSLKFRDSAGGWKEASFDVAAVTFGDDGVPVENTEAKYTIKAKGATYQAMLDKGFVYILIMPLKKPGIYQFRVALRDSDSGWIGSASQVVEVPDLSKQKLLISSIAVEDVSLEIWQNITEGKVGNGPGQLKVASTLMYDTVLKQFPAGSVLRYGFEVYNAKTANSGSPQLETQARILQNNSVIVQGNLNKFDRSAKQDANHLKISGAVLLKEGLPPGDYVLQLRVFDRVSRQTASQIFPFEIVK